jgi:hypothetical protein
MLSKAVMNCATVMRKPSVDRGLPKQAKRKVRQLIGLDSDRISGELLDT